MSTLLKKFALGFLSFLIIFTSYAPNILILHAQGDTNSGGSGSGGTNQDASSTSTTGGGSWYNQGFPQWYGKVFDTTNGSEIFGERYTAAQVQWVIYGLFSYILNGALGNSPEGQRAVACFLTNFGDINACADTLGNLLMGGVPNSSLAQNNDDRNVVELVFADRPFSGLSYVRNRFREFSLVGNVQAQVPGFGYSALAPVQSMWGASRDIAFGLFIVAAIVLAFMIMFRVKIAPQVVITIQSAIPRLIIALILVTFSYAIAGFLVDLMYVLIGLVSLVTAPLVSGFDPTTIFRFLTVGHALDLEVNFGFLFLGTVYLALFTIGFIVLLLLNLGVIGTALSAAGIALFTAATGGIFFLLALLVIIVVILAIIWYFIKIFWNLLKAFANILLLTIFAPIQITFGVFSPNFGFGMWLKSFVSNLLVFLVTSVLILFSFIFLLQGMSIGLSELLNFNNSDISQILFGTAFVGFSTLAGLPNDAGAAAWPPLLGNGGNNYGIALLFLGVSFVIFTLIPKANEVVQSLMTGKPFSYGTGLGEAIGPLGMGYLANQSSRQQGEYDAARRRPAPLGPDADEQRAQNIWSMIRTWSRGTIK